MEGQHQQWFAVRCCCTPRKVFGFLNLPVAGPDKRTVTDLFGQKHTVALMPIYVNNTMPCTMVDYLRNQDMLLDVAQRITLPEIAIYSDDRSIDFWRSIVGFVEAKIQEEVGERSTYD